MKRFRDWRRRLTRRRKAVSNAQNIVHHMIGSSQCIYHPIKIPTIELPKRWEVCIWVCVTYVQSFSLSIKNVSSLQKIQFPFIDTTAPSRQLRGLMRKKTTTRRTKYRRNHIYGAGPSRFIRFGFHSHTPEKACVRATRLRCGDLRAELPVHKRWSVLGRMTVISDMSRSSSDQLEHSEPIGLFQDIEVKKRAILWKFCRSDKDNATSDVKWYVNQMRVDVGKESSEESLENLNILNAGSCQSAVQSPKKRKECPQEPLTTDVFYRRAGILIEAPVRPFPTRPPRLSEESNSTLNVTGHIFPDSLRNAEEHGYFFHSTEPLKLYSIEKQNMDDKFQYLSSTVTVTRSFPETLSKHDVENPDDNATSLKLLENGTKSVRSSTLSSKGLPSQATVILPPVAEEKHVFKNTEKLPFKQMKPLPHPIIYGPAEVDTIRLQQNTDKNESTASLLHALNMSLKDFTKFPISFGDLAKRNSLQMSSLEPIRILHGAGQTRHPKIETEKVAFVSLNAESNQTHSAYKTLSLKSVAEDNVDLSGNFLKTNLKTTTEEGSSSGEINMETRWQALRKILTDSDNWDISSKKRETWEKIQSTDVPRTNKSLPMRNTIAEIQKIGFPEKITEHHADSKYRTKEFVGQDNLETNKKHTRKKEIHSEGNIKKERNRPAEGERSKKTITETEQTVSGVKIIVYPETNKPYTLMNTDSKKSTDPTRRRTKDHSMATGSEASVGVDGKTR
ncbi:hypothetical protein FGIG_06715, partial [Fasciola gigantica]